MSFFLATILTPLVRRLALKYKFIDIPDQRKIHATPTPTIGGLAVALAYFATLFAGLIYNSRFSSRISSDHIVIFLGGLCFLILGIVDDKKKLSAAVKFIFQTIIIITVLSCWKSSSYLLSNPFHVIWGPPSFMLNALAGGVINFIWIIFMVNAFNFIDGLDGLACGLALIGASSLFIVSLLNSKILVAYYFLVLIGSLTGFSRYNSYPAKIFLGDTGSMFIGYMLSTLSVVAEGRATITFSLVFPMIILGIPVYDTLTVILKRTYAGQPFFKPDKEHFHHRLLKKGFTQKEAVSILYIFSIILGAITFVTIYIKNEFAALICFIFALFVIAFTEKFGFNDKSSLESRKGSKKEDIKRKTEDGSNI